MHHINLTEHYHASYISVDHSDFDYLQLSLSHLNSNCHHFLVQHPAGHHLMRTLNNRIKHKKYSNIFTATVGIGMAAPFMKKLLDIPSFSTADVFDTRLHAVPSTE